MQIEFVEFGPAAGEALTAIAVLVFEGPALSEAAEATLLDAFRTWKNGS